MQITDVIYREDLYPRFNFDEETINLYRLNLDLLPPITVSANNILIDGYHRLIAHKIEQRNEIKVEILPITEDKDILKEAIKRNANHGRQLTMVEKKKWARYFFDQLTIQEIHDLLQVSTGKISEWTTDLKQAQSEAEKQKVIDLWLACKQQNEIAKETRLTEGRISQILNNFRNEKIKDFENNPPESLKLFNLWQFPKSSDELDFKGAPAQVVENLLWYYTKPFDVVYDPMAGGGSTIRVCQQMRRRWQASDISPVINEIRPHDITTGFPDWLTKPDFVYLDPP